MDKITIRDLCVNYHVGVPDEERARPQRLLLTIEIEADFSKAARSDDLNDTIDYFALTRRLLAFGENRSWKLLEKLVSDIASDLAADYPAKSIGVEVKKFIVAEARYISVSTSISRPRSQRTRTR